MLFPFGWPSRLQTPTSSSDPNQQQQETFIYLHADQEYVVAVTETTVSVWSGGAHRVRLGHAALSAADVEGHGAHAAACWSPERGRLAVLVSGCRGWGGAGGISQRGVRNRGLRCDSSCVACSARCAARCNTINPLHHHPQH